MKAYEYLKPGHAQLTDKRSQLLRAVLTLLFA